MNFAKDKRKKYQLQESARLSVSLHDGQDSCTVHKDLDEAEDFKQFWGLTF